MKKTRLLTLLLLSLLTYNVKAQLPAAYSARLQVVFDSMCNTLHVKGASAAVLVPNVGTWKSAYGGAEAGVPITPDMQFALNSNTKTYTSVLIFKLQEMGLLTIDDTIGTWFPNQPNIDGQITIRQLLNHTSGIYSFTNNPDFNDDLILDFTQIWQPESLLQYILTPDFPAGSSWNYSNSNYLLAGLIIKQVMAQPFSTTLTNLILQPQGLTNTFFFGEQSPTAVVPHPWSMNFGTSIQADLIGDFGYNNNAFYSSAYSAGGIFCTAEDNVNFWHNLMAGNIISPTSFQQMRTFVMLDFYTAYGMGIFRYKNYNSRLVYAHGGTGLGYINENCADSISGVCISVLTNQDSLSNGQIVKIVKALHRVTITPPTGVETLLSSMDLSIYPNPASDILHVGLAHARPGLLFQLLDLQGRVQLSRQVDGNSLEIAMSDYAPGLYMARISQDGILVRSEKIIVAR
jgi:D-alanyl-D-alanine carboxypeptidase